MAGKRYWISETAALKERIADLEEEVRILKSQRADLRATMWTILENIEIANENQIELRYYNMIAGLLNKTLEVTKEKGE